MAETVRYRSIVCNSPRTVMRIDYQLRRSALAFKDCHVMSEEYPLATQCLHCGGDQLYSTDTNAAGGYGPNLLPGLGGYFQGATIQVVVCRDCGWTQFFASKPALEKLEQASGWRKISE